MNSINRLVLRAFVAGQLFMPLSALADAVPSKSTGPKQSMGLGAGGDCYNCSLGVATGTGTGATGTNNAGVIVGNGNDFNDVSANIIASIQNLPGLLSGLAYLFGLLLGAYGVVKIKDAVENPQQTPMKDGAIRLACGGALFSLPIVYEAMKATIGTGAGVEAISLASVGFTGP